MGGKRIRSIMVAVVVAAVSGPWAASAGSPQAIDPSVGEVAARALRAAGVDPARAVVQDGPLNYAGPACPGAGWDCTDGVSPTVQVGAFNTAQCLADDCVIVQDGPSNTARCEQRRSDDADLTCAITQTTGAGSNVAEAIQVTDARVSTGLIDVDPVVQEQRASGDVDIDQDADAGGSNSAGVEQRLQQSATAQITVGPVTQTQEATADVSLEQATADGAGNNDADVTQWIDQRAHAQLDVGEISQTQNRDDDGQNIDLFLRQNSDAGDNEAQIEQAHVAQADGLGVLGPIEQLQGVDEQGLRGDVDQVDDGGHSNYDVAQRKWWNQSGTTLGDLTQIQDDLELCCLLGGAGRTPDTCSIFQFAQLTANGGAAQKVTQRAIANAKEFCSFEQVSSINGAVDTDEGGGVAFDHERGCAASCTVVARPLSRLGKALRAGDGSFGAGDEDPSQISAEPGEEIEYRLTYRNHGEAQATGVVVTDVVPERTTFLDCTGGCATTGSEPGSTITWDLGDVAPASSAVLTFRVGLDGEGFPTGTTDVDNTATTDSAEEEPRDSNVATASVTIVPQPSSSLSKDVRNESDQVELDPVFTTDTTAGSFDTVEWRIVYRNDGAGAATDVTISDVKPSGFSFVDCAAGCEETGPEGETLVWSLGTVEPDGVRTVTFRMSAGEVFGGAETNVAGGSSVEEGSFESNASTVFMPSCFAGFGGTAPTVIDFDDVPNGTLVTDQYTSSGITFLDLPESNPTAIAADGFGRTTHSDPNSLFGQNDTPSPGSVGTPMTMEFDPYVSRVGMYIGNAQAPLTATLIAYDFNGKQICSTTGADFDNDVQTFVGIDVSSPAIARVTLDYGDTTLAEEIDDVTFEVDPGSGPVL